MIPALAAIAAIATLALGVAGWGAICAAIAAAAIAHATRALIGGSLSEPLAAVAAAIASQLAVLAIVGMAIDGRPIVRPLLALAAMAWAFAELARQTSTPLVAMFPATVATILDPGCAALIAIAGARLPGPPWRRVAAQTKRGGGDSDGLPSGAGRSPVGAIVGGLVAVLAIVAGVADDGALATLGVRWYGGSPHAVTAGGSLGLLADAVGPLLGVAAVAGFAIVARGNRASVAIAGCLAGSLLVDLRAAAPGPTTLGLAALCGAIAVGRFAGTIRIASGQTIVGATCAVMLVVPPAWTAAEAAMARAAHVSIDVRGWSNIDGTGARFARTRARRGFGLAL